VGEETLRTLDVSGGCGAACGDGKRTGSGGNAGSTLATWCSWMEAFTLGSRNVDLGDV